MPAGVEKIIRDPLHDVIAFRLDRTADALLFLLIGAAEFQRLRRIRQLGMAGLAYPGADHSRYSHSLGVMQTARRILDRLRRSVLISDEEELACLAAALLHDLGHGPFSHVFERVSGIDHEEYTQRILQNPGSDVHRILAAHEPELPWRVLGLMEGRSPRAFFCDVLSSQLDADRFDYLLRDNLMTGSRYGDYDLNWLLHALTVHEPTGRLAVTWKGVSAVEAYLQARFHMYRNVYFHKVVRAAEGMVKLALQRATRLAVQDRLPWPPREHPVTKALTGRALTMEEFTDLDDVSVLHCFKTWRTAEDAPLASLCRGLLDRRLFKTIDLTHVAERERAMNAAEAAQRAVAAAGGDATYDVFYDEPADTPYDERLGGSGANPGIDQGCGGASQILVHGADGTLAPIGTVSPLSRALSAQLMFRRLHVAPPYRDIAESAVRSALG